MNSPQEKHNERDTHTERERESERAVLLIYRLFVFCFVFVISTTLYIKQPFIYILSLSYIIYPSISISTL